MNTIPEARALLQRVREGATPGEWAFTLDTYGGEFGDYQAAEIPNVAEGTWTENDGYVVPLLPADASLIVLLAGNPALLDAIDGMLAGSCTTCGHDESDHNGQWAPGECMAPGRATLCRCERFRLGADAERIASALVQQGKAMGL